MAVKKDKEKKKLHKENKYMYISQAWSRTTVRQAVGLQESHSDHSAAAYYTHQSRVLRQIKSARPWGMHYNYCESCTTLEYALQPCMTFGLYLNHYVNPSVCPPMVS